MHYSWDLPCAGKSVLNGIGILSEFIKKSAQMCYILCGFNTSFSEDLERINTLKELNIRPYVMIFQDPHKPTEKAMDYDAIRLRHLSRYVNAPACIYKTSPFSEYEGWARAQEKMGGAIQMQLSW